MHIFLNDVVVSARRKKRVTPYESVLGVITIKQEKIEQTAMDNLITFLEASLPGISIQKLPALTSPNPMDDLKFDVTKKRKGHIKSGVDEVMLILNEYPIYDPDQALATLQMLNVKDIKQIDYNRHAKDGLAWFPMTGAKFIAITLKDGLEPQQYVDRNRQQIQLLGYQKPVAFYSPKYETRQQQEKELPDLRTTLYWNPTVQTDEQGKASLEFYTGDSETTFSVVVEGVTDDGKLVRTVVRY